MSTTPNPWPDPPVGRPDQRPVSRASTLALQFALLPLLVNVVVNGFSIFVAGQLQAGADVSGLMTLDTVLVMVGRVAVLVLVVLSVINIVRAWRETAGGHLRGRVRTVVALLLCVFHVASTVVVFLVVPTLVAS